MSYNFLEKICKWQDTRMPWAIIIFITIALVFIAHFLFQKYLFMEPCEQCVYIRFDMLVIALGAIIVFISPKSDIAKIFGYTFGFYGIWLGIEHCLLLNHIHEAVHSGNPFTGTSGCREIPIYPFNLHLYEWLPQWFLPSGECGIDAPVVPESAYATLSFFQKIFIGNPPNFGDGLYSNGWYLIPKWQFLNMAMCCLIIFICCFIMLFLMFISFVFSKKRARVLAIIIFIFIVTLKITGKSRTPVLVSINDNCEISLFLNNA
ncbi:protein-disulfide oxidoreductase DsbI [Campylobacter sp. TTU-622]|uniref:protein-disulfide oxidoreductase DsbI n=1 Tax=Campylobacter sp. TTU-622 TaxID=2800583 RepID=UPI001905642A|nr:protein-disulfide oxidoreductase DsbI [Campylobacter sp. TTU-622]MBK1973601.1 protein-disulfide oxidoreductase DsbI [Campylobacter sp. TTU-622]